MQIDWSSVAEIYDLYVTADYDIPFFLSETTKVVGPVLELAAGTGRLSLPLLRAGVLLTCVDSSKGMLAVLSLKLREHALYADVRCADICRLHLPASFHLAILPFQAFMEIAGEDRQRQALSAVFGCLAQGGRFICTLHNPAVRRASVDGMLHSVGRYNTPDGTLSVSGFEHGGRPLVRRLQIFEFFGNDGRLRGRKVLRMEFELVEMDRFESMARGAGFRVVQLYGDYDRSAFDPVRSPVMIWVLEKGAILPADGSDGRSTDGSAPQANGTLGGPTRR